MQKTKEEIQEYAIIMRGRGESYRTILNYIKSKTSDEDTITDIISHLDQLEKSNNLKISKEYPGNLSITNTLLGSLFLISGIVLIFFLWGKGFISTIPFMLIGIGMLALTGGIK